MKVKKLMSTDSKECIVCYYWYFNNLFEFQKSVFTGCRDILMISPNIDNISTITVKSILYPCFNYGISKSSVINLLENYKLDDKECI